MSAPAIDLPDAPSDAAWHEAMLTPRYEDFAQDGRLRLVAMPPCLGATTWRHLLARPESATFRAQGIVPIMVRFVARGAPGPHSPASPLTARGAYDHAETRSENGEVERLLVRMWAEAWMPHGTAYGPAPDGPPVLAARAYAEHVVTRLFAPPEQRKVTSLPGVVAGARVAWKPPAACAVVPEGARLLDAAPVLDPAPIAFGLTHTDSNQHVNSMVYPALFEDALLRRLAAHGEGRARLASELEVGFRKPSFAGDVSRVAVQAFALPDGRVGGVGFFVPAAEAGDLGKARPTVYATIIAR